MTNQTKLTKEQRQQKRELRQRQDADFMAVIQGRMTKEEFNRKYGGPLTAEYLNRRAA